jgi:aspartate kinase
MIVMKFGGTSVQDGVAIRQVAAIVADKKAQDPIVVVSAMSKVTDGLIRIGRTARAGQLEESLALITQLRERHLLTARELLENKDQNNPSTYQLTSVEAAISQRFTELENLARSVATLGELTARTLDAIVSYGERLSSLLVAACFNAQGLAAVMVDSREFIITDSQFTCAAPVTSEIARRCPKVLVPLVESGKVPVAQGFIGATLEGETTTLGRGGSDYSGALIGAALKARAIEIWTDVDGMMTTDPRVVKEAKRIRVISFAEAAELSYFGAKVLHPATVLPAVELRIPVYIFNTKNPTCEGTKIVADPQPSSNLIKGIAFKRKVTIVNVTSTRMLNAYGFLRALFELFEQHQTSVDVVTTSEVSVSVTLDTIDRLEAIQKDLSGFGDVRVEEGKAIVCVVGDALKFRPGVAARLFRAVSSINVNMISQGSSEINVTFVIDDCEVEKAARLIHDEFFQEVDPSVFA